MSSTALPDSKNTVWDGVLFVYGSSNTLQEKDA